MNDAMPDFEWTDPVAEPPAPKKPRRKPAKKRKAVALPVPKKRAVKKRKVAKRRGRPAGSLNKPKPAEQHHGGRFSPELYNLIGQLLGLTAPERAFIYDVVARITK
jgi:hypothetical protein